jgi:alpha-glucosidase
MRKELCVAVLCSVSALGHGLGVQSQPVPATAGALSWLGSVTGTRTLPNGIEVRAGEAALRVEALREDVLRVRIVPDGKWQEDASWAVVPGRVKAQAAVTSFADAQSVGFDTKALKVRVERASTRLVVTDHAGHVISEDALGRPAEFTGPRDAQGGEFKVWKTLRADEHFFGLGDKTGPLDRRAQAFDDWNTDAFLFQESTDPIYKSIPFFLGESGSRYYGVFLDNTWRATFDFGRGYRDAISFGSDGGSLDYYLFYGPEPKAVVENYAWLTGYAPLPPLWSLGYQQSRYSYAPQSQLRDVAERLRKDKIPADVLWLDIGFQDRNRPFTTDPVGYADFPKLVADMAAKNFHLITITDLHVAYAPDQGYAPYDTGLQGDHFVKNANGTTYTGESWPGMAVFPDFTQSATRAWWGTNYKPFVDAGVAGFWEDMNEPSIRNEPTHTMPLTTVHRIEGTGFAPRLATHREVHNVFGAQNARATYEGVLKLRPNERPYVMTRATYAGGQRYSVTWTGDNTSTWNHLRMTTNMLENLGLSGFAFAGADVGAHVGSPQPDLLTKWLEMAAFQPIDRNHSAKNSNPQEVWVNGPQREDVARKFINVRYRLLPYSYTLAEETSRTGLPMLRPLFLEFPHAAADGHPIDLDSKGEFMLGSDILVALPAFLETMNQYSPLLPGNVWYDFWTGLRVPKGRSLSAIAADTAEFSTATLQPPSTTPKQQTEAPGGTPRVKLLSTINELPVYVRGGAIIPMQALVQSTAETPKGPLELHVFPGPDCKGSLYSDDGHSFNYQRGEYLRTTYHCAISKDGVGVLIGKREGSFAPWWSQVEVVVYGISSAKAQAMLDGKVVASSYDAVMHALHVLIPESAEGHEIRIEGL